MVRSDTARRLALGYAQLASFIETSIATRHEADACELFELLWRVARHASPANQTQLVDVAEQLDILASDQMFSGEEVEELFAGTTTASARVVVAECARPMLRLLGSQLLLLVAHPEMDAFTASTRVARVLNDGDPSVGGGDFLTSLYGALAVLGPQRDITMRLLADADRRAYISPSPLRVEGEALWSTRNEQAWLAAVTEYAWTVYLEEPLLTRHALAVDPTLLEGMRVDLLERALAATHTARFRMNTSNTADVVQVYARILNLLAERLTGSGNAHGRKMLKESVHIESEHPRHYRARDAIAYANRMVEQSSDWPKDRELAASRYRELLQPVTVSNDALSALVRDAGKKARRG